MHRVKQFKGILIPPIQTQEGMKAEGEAVMKEMKKHSTVVYFVRLQFRHKDIWEGSRDWKTRSKGPEADNRVGSGKSNIGTRVRQTGHA